MFRGTSILSLDAKGRLAIPSRYRERLIVEYDNKLVVTVSAYEPCLWLYPLREWEENEKRLAALPDDPAILNFKRYVRAKAEDVAMDGQGRVLLPQSLRDHVKLDKQIACLGQGAKFELWDESRWKAIEAAGLPDLRAPGEVPESLRNFSFS
jgi:MraZ protein